VYAGAAGRFSTDPDFSVAKLDDEPGAVIPLLVDAIDGARLGLDADVRLTSGHDLGSVSFETHAA
jgi:hypothetical protein